MVRPKRAAHGHAERAGEHHVVSHLRVNIEGDVRAVERDVVLEQWGDAPIVRTGERPQSTPEQSVVHQEQIDLLVGRHSNRGLVQVHGGAHPGHLARVRHLQAVERLGDIPHLPHVQVVVQIPSEFS